MGIGNLLLGDEGVGVHAAKKLKEQDLPEWVEVVDAGTAFLDVMPEFENSERIIVMDAMMANGDPGTVYRVPLKDCMRKGRLDSMHGFDIFRMLDMAGNKKDTEVVVFGVEPSEIKWSLELSEQVSRSIPCLLEIIYREISI